ncbi:rhodanese-like domain-containing protein [Arcobacter sp. LA11]|uniref:rhodanese-like domain-containing protein n=1 Tax=Arcobacter sp. LA11 TaxID=1898176 RepID=UPI000934B638|nr:rhodanese-like domain-containing protein [Arcobacter sp. LA11]
MNEQIKHYEDKLKYEIDSWDLNESLKVSDSIIVIDARSKSAYEHERIPNSINIPHKTMNDNTTKNLPKNRIYVTYCDGIGCNASTKGALNMARLGFQVKELIGGIEWWIRDGHQTHGKNARKNKNIQCAC